LRADLARCQASGRARLAFGATRDALGGALLLILLALSLVRRRFLIACHYVSLSGSELERVVKDRILSTDGQVLH
jgi:hypothetical protein